MTGTNISLRASDGSLGRSAELLRESPMLRRLELVGDAVPPRWPSKRRHLGFWKALMNYDDACDLRQPLNLESLSLRQLDLLFCDSRLFTNINFYNLVTLDVVGMSGISRFIRSLLNCFSSHPPRLKKIQMSCHRDDSIDMVALSDLLMRCTGLTHISIHTTFDGTGGRPPPMPGPASFSRHKSTLRSLSFSAAEWDDVEYTRQAHPCPSALLHPLLGAAPGIEELAVWLGNIPDAVDDEGFLDRIRKIAVGLPALRALRIFGWHMTRRWNAYHQPTIDIFRAFTDTRPGKEYCRLRALLFEPHHDCCPIWSITPEMQTKERVCRAVSPEAGVCFVPKSQMGLQGRVTLSAENITKAELRYRGVHPDIFDD